MYLPGASLLGLAVVAEQLSAEWEAVVLIDIIENFEFIFQSLRPLLIFGECKKLRWNNKMAIRIVLNTGLDGIGCLPSVFSRLRFGGNVKTVWVQAEKTRVEWLPSQQVKEESLASSPRDGSTSTYSSISSTRYFDHIFWFYITTIRSFRLSRNSFCM